MFVYMHNFVPSRYYEIAFVYGFDSDPKHTKYRGIVGYAETFNEAMRVLSKFAFERHCGTMRPEGGYTRFVPLYDTGFDFEDSDEYIKYFSVVMHEKE